ncbi:MAG TPA: hypothetical protein VHH88_08495 [Verrucomicrobiae bacterium]|nr:hypothetical protein [Verrucomicrobiae bacterium]
MSRLLASASMRRFRFGSLILAVAVCATATSNAGLTFRPLIYHTAAGLSASAGYTFTSSVATNSIGPDAPLGHYVISSPTNAWHTEFDLTSAGPSSTYNYGPYYTDFDAALRQLTNGNWTITVTNATSTNTYAFSFTASDFTSNGMSAAVVPTFPVNNDFNITNQPTFTWQGPSGWEGSLTVEDYNQDFSFFKSASLPPDQTSWNTGAILPDGDHSFFVSYTTNTSSILVASTPLNTNTAAPISGWVSTSSLQTYALVSFSVTSPSSNPTNGVISGGITNQADDQTFTISDGTHSAQFLWSENSPGSSAWIYATFNTAVAVAPGVTDVTQITNAAAYTFQTTAFDAIGPVLDAGANGGVGQFVVLKSSQGFYAVVRIDDVKPDDTLDATWWFQTDGTADFSAAGGSGLSLAASLDTTNLTWTTGGDLPWFPESTNSFDGTSAAQSGAITDDQSSWLETTVPIDGQVSFWWQVSSEQYADNLSFSINGVQQDAISGQVDWTQATYAVSAGDVLRWEYDKDSSVSGGSDAGWLDQVVYSMSTTQAPISIGLTLTINQTRNFQYGLFNYNAFASITYMDPPPVTTNYLVSSDTVMHTEVLPGNSTSDVSFGETTTSLDDLIHSCTNGQWTLYINRGSPEEQVYHFSVSITGLDTSVLSPMEILVPTNNAVDVPTNTPFQWTGPSNFDEVFVEGYQTFPSFAYDGYTNLDGTALAWPSPPGFLYGTNIFYVSADLFSFDGASFSTPVDSNLNPIDSWEAELSLQSQSQITFVVGAPAPIPVQLSSVPPQAGGGDFKLAFQTVAGRPETIQIRTNLLSGDWVDYTNFIGDGSTYQLDYAITNSPGAYFRVITQ